MVKMELAAFHSEVRGERMLKKLLAEIVQWKRP